MIILTKVDEIEKIEEKNYYSFSLNSFSGVPTAQSLTVSLQSLKLLRKTSGMFFSNAVKFSTKNNFLTFYLTGREKYFFLAPGSLVCLRMPPSTWDIEQVTQIM